MLGPCSGGTCAVGILPVMLLAVCDNCTAAAAAVAVADGVAAVASVGIAAGDDAAAVETV